MIDSLREPMGGESFGPPAPTPREVSLTTFLQTTVSGSAKVFARHIARASGNHQPWKDRRGLKNFYEATQSESQHG